MKPKYIFNQAILICILTALVALTLVPFYMAAVTSQKTAGEIIKNAWSLPKALYPEYYIDGFLTIWPYMLNSLIIGFISVSLSVILASLGGYVFAKLQFKGKRLLFILMLALMMIPGVMTLIPSFMWYKQFPLVGGNDWLGNGGTGFLNTRLVLIIPVVAGGQIFGIFLCRAFLQNLPKSLFEAARIDGASELQVYRYIAVPLSLPILATLAITTFVGVYNEYIWPLITVSNDTIQVFAVGVTKFQSENNLQQGPMMAGYLIGSLPLLLTFIFGMKYYVKGMTEGAIRA